MKMSTGGRARPGATGPAGQRNYMTPRGYARLKTELAALLDRERPELVKVIAWAASNGDRSENGDYIYGKRRLREIDRRIRYLTQRLDSATVVDPADREATDRVYFGATVTVCSGAADERTITIVGIDEADPARGHVSWIAPLARALLGRRLGDAVTFKTPAGEEEIEITDVRYTAVTGDR